MKLILQAFANKAPRTPVWLMRQAGRHLPEYLAIKAKHTFLEMCQSSDLSVEVSLQPIRRYNMDGIICFSDILVPLHALGMELDFTPAPVFAKPVSSLEDLEALPDHELESRIPSLLETLKRLRSEADRQNKTLLGFSAAPYTLATYAIEGKGSKDFDRIKGLMFKDPLQFQKILNWFGDLIVDYSVLQYKAGAEVIQLFDSWAGHLSVNDFQEFVLPSVQTIFARLKALSIPTIYYINGGPHLLCAQIEAGADTVSVDWRLPLEQVLERVPASMGVQGNLDPAALLAAPEIVIQKTRQLLKTARGRQNFILNAGHGLIPKTPVESVKAFIDTALYYAD